MVPPARTVLAIADVLVWQTGYRLALAISAGLTVLVLRGAAFLELSVVSRAALGVRGADLLLGTVTAGYVLLALGIRRQVLRHRRAGAPLSTGMALADQLFVFVLVFLLAEPEHYEIGLFVALVFLQLTHVYFGRVPALLLLVFIGAAYLLLNDLAQRLGGAVQWEPVLVRLAIVSLGGWILTRVQSDLQERLGRLVVMFERAEEGDFTESYDVAADRRPDAITAVGRAYNRMRTQLAGIVLTDPLSGCLNRRGFEQQYRRELARAARAQTDLAVIALDLDHFKEVNDTHGHLVGDQVIAEAGALLRASARAGDVVARTGGEEFMVLAPGTNREGALLLAQRILDAFRGRVFAEPRARVAVTLSAGVVATAVSSEGIAEAIRAQADEALYAAKRAGRDRVVVFGGKEGVV